MNFVKSLTLSIMILILYGQPHAQERIAYYDAITFFELYKNNQSTGVPLDNRTWEILKYYFQSQASLQADVASNPFLKEYFDVGGSASITATLDKNILQQGASAFGSTVGGLNVTTIADGIAQFLVSRTKEELSLAFFKKFKTTIEDSPELEAFFPKTLAILNVIDQDVYQFSNYLNTLREAFKKDLDTILVSLEDFINSKKTKLFEADSTDSIGLKLEYFQAATIFARNIKEGNHPAEAIAAINNITFNSNNTPLLQLQESIKLFSIFSNSLRSTQTERYWIPSDSLKLLWEPATFNIYLGLLYQKHGEQVIFGNEFKTYLEKIKDGTVMIKDYKKYLQSLIQKTENVQLSMQSIKKRKEKGEQIDSYNEVFVSSTQLLSNMNDLSILDGRINFKLNERLVRVIELLSDVYTDINEKKYNALVLDVSLLLSELFGEFTWEEDFIKYGTFIANVAQAESPGEVQSAIEAIALPAGSASIKKNTKFNLSLNAYTGIFYGNEYLQDPNQGWADVYGVSAPIGVAASWGVTWPHKKVHFVSSFSLYGTLIDVGALAAYRFNDAETETLPEIKLANIFAPGIYGVFGIRNIPISAGFGFQQGPALREVSIEDPNNQGMFINETANGYRWSVFLAVDIPLINFYTKSK